jgi:haloalkane dehalogenase
LTVTRDWGVYMSTAPLTRRYQDVEGKRVAFHERGEVDAIVFLHGNPTSSHISRNVVRRGADQGRCIVPHLIGHAGVPSPQLP